MYHAAVRSGAGVLNGLKSPTSGTVTNVGACVVASEANRPAAVTPSVSGASADTEKAPSQPYGASGIV